MKPKSLPVYEVADANVVDFYFVYKAAKLKKAAARERVIVLPFESWFSRVFLKEAA